MFYKLGTLAERIDADGVFADAAEVEFAVVFDVGNLRIAVTCAVLEVLDDATDHNLTQNPSTRCLRRMVADTRRYYGCEDFMAMPSDVTAYCNSLSFLSSDDTSIELVIVGVGNLF